MNVGWKFRKLAKIAAVAVSVLPSLVQAFIPSVSDHIGTIHRLLDATSGETVGEYEYDPYGVLLGEAGSKTDSCPFRFSGKYYDSETQLLYFGYRYYNPVSTKWLTVDPLQERGGLNFTAYCGGDPVNQVDLMGMEIYQYDDQQLDRFTPQGYWPYFYSDSWNPIEQVGVVFGNFGSFLVNTTDLGVDKLGNAADKLCVDEIQMSCIANGFPDPGDAFFASVGLVAGLGRMVRTADHVGDALDVVSDTSRVARRTERVVDIVTDKPVRDVVNETVDSRARFVVDPSGVIVEKSRPTFYVAPDGVAIPATGYRYMNSKYAAETMETMSAPKLSYFGFDKLDVASEVADRFQILRPQWSDARMRGKFDTLQLFDQHGRINAKVPMENGGLGVFEEPFATFYPPSTHGRGGGRQLVPIVDNGVFFDQVLLLREGKR